MRASDKIALQIPKCPLILTTKFSWILQNTNEKSILVREAYFAKGWTPYLILIHVNLIKQGLRLVDAEVIPKRGQWSAQESRRFSGSLNKSFSYLYLGLFSAKVRHFLEMHKVHVRNTRENSIRKTNVWYGHEMPGVHVMASIYFQTRRLTIFFWSFDNILLIFYRHCTDVVPVVLPIFNEYLLSLKRCLVIVLRILTVYLTVLKWPRIDLTLFTKNA